MERNVPLGEYQNLEQFKNQLTKFMLSLPGPDILSTYQSGPGVTVYLALLCWRNDRRITLLLGVRMI